MALEERNVLICIDTYSVNPHNRDMDAVVVKCAFCLTRHLIILDQIDTWFVLCTCGSRGFIEDDQDLMESKHGGPGFTVKEASTPNGRRILLSDPVPVHVDEWARRWYVSWYLFLTQEPDGPEGVWSSKPGDGDLQHQ
jgi:hypothetical protein